MMNTTAQATGVALQQITRDAGYVPENSSTEALLDKLGAVRLVELAAEQHRRAIVAQLRAGGASWSQVGDALGTSRQNAQQRFGGTK